jgi:hypothetical protein
LKFFGGRRKWLRKNVRMKAVNAKLLRDKSTVANTAVSAQIRRNPQAGSIRIMIAIATTSSAVTTATSAGVG